MLSRIDTFSSPPPSSTAFRIWQRRLDERANLIAIEGELDLSTAPHLKWMLLDSLETGFSQLIVDLSLATFMDSTTLGVLLGVKRRLHAGGRLAIVCPRTDVLKIFELAGMDDVFAVFPLLDEALASVRGDVAHLG